MKSYPKAPLELRNGYLDEKRREAIRAMPCIACEIRKVEQKSRTEFHHFIGMGNGLKASDLLSIPLGVKKLVINCCYLYLIRNNCGILILKGD